MRVSFSLPLVCLLIFFLSQITRVHGQSEPLDSLRVRSLIDQADSVSTSQPELAEAYLREAIQLSTDGFDSGQVIRAAQRLLFHLHSQSQYTEAYEAIAQLKARTAETLPITQLQELQILEVLALEKLDSLTPALRICEQLAAEVPTDDLKATIAVNRGRLLSSLNRPEEAIQEYIQADQLYAKLQDTSRRFEVLNHLGVEFMEHNDGITAIKYLQWARDLLSDQSTYQQRSRIYGNLGAAFASIDDQNNAFQNYQLALSAARTGGLVIDQARMLMNIGNIDLNRGNCDKAIKSYNESLEICRKFNNSYCIAVNNMNIGKCLTQLGRFKEAIEAFNKTQELLDTSLVSRETAYLFDKIAAAHAAAGNTEEGYQYLRKYIAIYTELFEADRDRTISDLRIKYESEVNEQKLETAKLRNDQQQKRIRGLSITIGLLLLLSGVVVSLLTERNKRLKFLYQKNVEIMDRLNLQPAAGSTTQPPHNWNDPKFTELHQVLSSPEFLRNPEATLSLLSERMALPESEVSELLKDFSNMNYKQLLNYYRSIRARELITERGRTALIKEVMYECGYTNKSTFYYAFLHNTGLSPSEFRQQVIQNKMTDR